MSDFYLFLLGALGVWRITYFLHAQEGPWRLMARLREWTGRGFGGALLDCFYCLSTWVAAPFAYGLGENWIERLLLWPALSAAAILLERLTREPQAPAALYVEDLEDENGMLRRR